jgi:hypothetical protein
METSTDLQYRIGAVSRLAGVPVTTLRIWETRYGAFAPEKSLGRHRLYSRQDVERAVLLRRLTEQGHAISRVAQQDVDGLNALLELPRAMQAERGPSPATVAVLGLGLLARYERAILRLIGANAAPAVVHAGDDLSSTPTRAFEFQADLCLVRAPSLHDAMASTLRRLRTSTGARQVAVIYAFGQEPVIQSLRRDGFLIRREPLSDADLSDWLRSMLRPGPATPPAQPAPVDVIPGRRFDDAQLQAFASHARALHCECPRHVAEIVQLLASFENYSQDCLNRDADDAALHARLAAIAGSSRAMFEDALEQIARSEGLWPPAASQTAATSADRTVEPEGDLA